MILTLEQARTVLEGLTKWWYEYVGLDHHKDRDCHWYINQVWSYGNKPFWRIEHYGYIFQPSDLDDEYETYEQAQMALLELLVKAINEEKKWAKRVLSKPEMYDETAIKKAKIADAIEYMRKI